MNDCTHDWLIMGIGDVDDDAMELDGWLELQCDHCGATARFPRPCYKLLWQITRATLQGMRSIWKGDTDELVDVREPIDYRTASDDLPSMALFSGTGGGKPGQTSLDGGEDVDGGMVAELVNALDLWEVDDDIPF